MKSKNIIYSLFSAAIASCMLLSCSSNDGITDKTDVESSINDLLSSNKGQSVLVDIDYHVSSDYKISFNVYSENPYEVTSNGIIKKENVTPILNGMTDANGKFSFSKYIPDNVNEIYITSDNAGVPMMLHGVISNGSVTPELFDMNSMIENTTSNSRGSNYTSFLLGEWNYLGKPKYIDNVSFKIGGAELKDINKSLPEWERVNDKFTTSKGISVDKDAEIWLSVISDKSIFNNAIGYYCYNNSVEKDNVKEILAFPSTRTYTLLNDGLHNGEYIKLKYLNPTTGEKSDVFPAGTNIGWVLRTSAYNMLTSTVTEGWSQFYSEKSWNPEKTKKSHTAIFSTAKGNIILAFEDMNNEGFFGGDNDCNDVILHVASKPSDAIKGNITEIEEDKEPVTVVENQEAVKPLSGIVSTTGRDYRLNNIFVYSKSNFTVVDNNVESINDVIYISNRENINNIILKNCSEKSRANLMVSLYDILSRRGKVIHTTVKDYIIEVSASRSIVETESKSPADIIESVIEKYKESIMDGVTLRIEFKSSFEPVPYKDFVNAIPLPPYSAFIVND